MTEIMSSLIANIISEYAKKIVEKASQGKRITTPELMVLIMSEMDRRLTTQIQELDKGLTTQIEALRREFNGRFKGLEDTIKALELRINGLEDRMKGFEDRFKGLEDRIKALELRVDGLEKRIDYLKFYIDQYHRETMDRIRRIQEKLGIT